MAWQLGGPIPTLLFVCISVCREPMGQEETGSWTTGGPLIIRCVTRKRKKERKLKETGITFTWMICDGEFHHACVCIIPLCSPMSKATDDKQLAHA